MPIYLDHNATTPLDSRVLEAMMPHLTTHFGNPSSVHRWGRAARNALDAARRQVGDLVGVPASQVIFTSCATEANNLALKGLCARLPAGRLLVSAVEHAAVLEPAQDLPNWLPGWRVESIPVDEQGVVRLDSLAQLLAQGDVRMVSVMAANNETGVVQPIEAIAAQVRKADALFHCDAVQAAAKLPLNFAASGAHAMSLSAHKLYGPKGVGALVVDPALAIAPGLIGGGQEQGLRGGTENLPAIVGFGAAAELAATERQTRAAHTQQLRDKLETGLAQIPGITVFGQQATRLPNTCQFGVAGMEGSAVQMGLDRQGLAVGTGSACHSSNGEPSHVLLAMGIAEDQARSAIRVSFGQDNTLDDVEKLLMALRNLNNSLPISAML
ncbi:MAG TPA: cysteine desulfurase family protein [Gammaproteobacteria bacterium]|nr:cysteine desulfurase family protein [Gammaproteobacteria bacterium]